MIYDEPVFRLLGDVCLSVELGDESGIPVNFRAISLQEAIGQSGIPGIVEINLQTRSMGIVYNPFEIKTQDLIARIEDAFLGMEDIEELPSRLITIPVLYHDPWTLECAKAHEVSDNLVYLAERNGMTPQDLIGAHSSTDYWVAAVGFTPGVYIAFPIDYSKMFNSTQYQRPRTWTPAGAIVIAADSSTNGHSVPSPGGSQMIGRTPISLYDPKQKNKVFADNPVLTQVTDRHRYVPITLDEFREIEEEVEAGTYEYRVECGTFALETYHEINKNSAGRGGKAGECSRS